MTTSLSVVRVLAGGYAARGCSVEIKECFFFSTCVCLWRSVSGNYIRELVNKATTIRLATVISVFSFQGCHTGKTMQHTSRLLRELSVFCRLGALGLSPQHAARSLDTSHGTTIDRLSWKTCATCSIGFHAIMNIQRTIIIWQECYKYTNNFWQNVLLFMLRL